MQELGLSGLGHLPKVTQLPSGRAKLHFQAGLLMCVRITGELVENQVPGPTTEVLT